MRIEFPVKTETGTLTGSAPMDIHFELGVETKVNDPNVVTFYLESEVKAGSYADRHLTTVTVDKGARGGERTQTDVVLDNLEELLKGGTPPAPINPEILLNLFKISSLGSENAASQVEEGRRQFFAQLTEGLAAPSGITSDE